jgi:serine/threonine protein kinase
VPLGTYQAGDEPIAGFRLVDALGRGLFGEVWIADDVAGGRVVAVKVVDLTFSRGAVGDFGVLGRMTALSHPNLIPVYTTRLKDKAGRELDPAQAELARQRGELRELVIVMGLGENSLADRLREVNPDDAPGQDRKGLPVEELIRYMEGAADGIDYLNQPDHRLGPGVADGPVVHCAVNPRNLLVVAGEARLADAGLAALFPPDARRTLATGAPVYLAPELSANQPCPGTDQYALALSYYELRTGRLPFDEGLGHTSIILAHAHGKLDLTSPVLVEPERAVLKRATALQPPDRYPSCVTFVRELSRAVAGLFPKQSVRTLTDTQGVPYPSPLRPDSYWKAVLPPSIPEAPAPSPPAQDDGTPPDPAQATPTAPTLDLFALGKALTPPPAAGQPGVPKLAYPSVRATPILLPLEDPPAAEKPPTPETVGTDATEVAPALAATTTAPPRPAPPPPPVAPPPVPAPRAMETPARPPTPPPEPPDWYKEAQAETLTFPPGSRADTPPGRWAAVRYYARMRSRRAYELLVTLSGDGNLPGDRPAVEVEPVLPGCTCTPPRAVVRPDPSGETTATFWVVPHARGRVPDARVVVREGGRVVAEVPLAATVGTTAWAWAAAAAGLIAPYVVLGLRSARLDPAARPDGLPVFEWLGRWIADNVRPEWPGLGLLGLAAVLFLWSLPRRRDVFREVG